MLQPSTEATEPKTASGAASGASVSTKSSFLNSRSLSSSGRPTERSVVEKMATRSHSRSASSRRWVVRKIVTPRWRSPSISSCTSRVATGSRPDVGSSKKTTSGSFSSARASPTRWRRPLERVPHGSLARPAMLTASRARLYARTGVGQAVEAGEALQVLGHAQAEVEPGRLGHDRDALADLDPVGRVRAKPATTAEPELGAMRVPSMRTVVVLPAPFGPRNPNTSPLATLSDRPSTAVRSPKRLVRCWVTRASSDDFAPVTGGFIF